MRCAGSQFDPAAVRAFLNISIGNTVANRKRARKKVALHGNSRLKARHVSILVCDVWEDSDHDYFQSSMKQHNKQQVSTPKTEQSVSAIRVVISGGNELVCEPLRRLKALF